MHAKSARKAITVQLPIDFHKKLERVAHRNHLQLTNVIRFCLFEMLPIIEKEGITIKPGPVA